MALSRPQRLAIHERDSINNTPSCMFPHLRKQNCYGRLEVHHIMPQRWLHLKKVEWECIDIPDNLLTICKYAHTHIIHPDIEEAYRNYGKNKNSFEETFALRNTLAEQEIPYWNTKFDDEMLAIAQHRTRIAYLSGWNFPHKRFKESLPL